MMLGPAERARAIDAELASPESQVLIAHDLAVWEADLLAYWSETLSDWSLADCLALVDWIDAGKATR